MIISQILENVVSTFLYHIPRFLSGCRHFPFKERIQILLRLFTYIIIRQRKSFKKMNKTYLNSQLNFPNSHCASSILHSPKLPQASPLPSPTYKYNSNNHFSYPIIQRKKYVYTIPKKYCPSIFTFLRYGINMLVRRSYHEL